MDKYFFVIVEFLAAVASLIFWKGTRRTKLHLLPFFLWFIVCVETANMILGFHGLRAVTKMVYVFSIPVEFSFYLYLVYLHVDNFGKKAIPILFILFNIINILGQLIQTTYTGIILTVLLGDISVILAVCFYLVDLFNKETALPLFHNYFFWIAAGLLLFCLGEISYNFLNPYIKANNLDEYGKLFKLIMNSLLVVLYGSYIVALYVHHKQVKKNAT